MKRTRYIYMTMLCISIIILSSLQLHQTYAKEQQQQHALYQLPSSQITPLIERKKHGRRENTTSEKATILANLLATSSEYGAYNGQINVGFDPEEGLPEPTPQCKRIMNHWTKKCLVEVKNIFHLLGFILILILVQVIHMMVVVVVVMVVVAHQVMKMKNQKVVVVDVVVV